MLICVDIPGEIQAVYICLIARTFSARPKLNHPAHKKRTGRNEYTYLNKDFIENINKLKLYKNRKLQPLDNGGHKMTAVSKEFFSLNNGGHKMTAVSKEIQPLDNGGHKMTAVSKEIQSLDNGGH